MEQIQNHSIRAFNKSLVVSSVICMVVGVLFIVFDGVLMDTAKKYAAINSYYDGRLYYDRGLYFGQGGLQCGLLLIVTGVLGAATARSGDKAPMMGFFVMCIVSLVILIYLFSYLPSWAHNVYNNLDKTPVSYEEKQIYGRNYPFDRTPSPTQQQLIAYLRTMIAMMSLEIVLSIVGIAVLVCGMIISSKLFVQVFIPALK